MPAELISAAAFQVYRKLDIASAKPTAEERKCVPHHLIDVVDVEDRFTVAQWLGLAEAAIDGIRGRGAMPIVVGGTHLYIKALHDGLFEGPGADEAIRAELAAMDPSERRAERERIDPEAALRIHANDDRRTIRALEVFRLTGTPISTMQKQWDREPGRHGADRSDRRLVILDWEVPELNSRINARVKRMVQDGLVAETRAVADRLGPTAREALGTKQVLRHLVGACTLDEAIEQIKIETRRFAKNQRTWMRRLAATPGAMIVRPADRPLADIAQDIVNSILAG